MAHPILITKLFIPPARPELVTRSRLIEQINHCLHRKLTLISAPAGFGKTTLVTDWLQSQGDDASSPFLVGWLSLDEGDNDVVRFVTYLLTALNRIQGLETEFGVGALQMLQSPQPPSLETVLIAVINEIAMVTDKIVLILDDYHLIDSQQVHESLNFLLENLPPQLHLVITTREDPPIPISRLRAGGQLNELRALDLRFTLEETAVFLNQIMGLHLSASDIAALETRTEGWITGLQMAAISMQGSKDVDGFIKSFAGSHRFVLDYLIEEVLDQQTEEIQTFLMKTAVLDRLTGPLCDAVTGQGNSQEILEKLDHANLFIIPLDNERHWYRYHHLFYDLLQQRLRQKMGNHLAKLHGKASAWYEQNDMVSDAVRHALAAKDFARVASLAEMAWQAMDNNFQSNIWLNWVKTLPNKLVRNRPVLCTQYAWALWLCGELEASETRLREAERWLESGGNSIDALDGSVNEMVVVDREMFRTLPVSIAHLRGSNAQARGDFSAAQKYLELALSLTSEDDQFTQASLTVDLGFIYWANGDLERAHAALANWISSMRMAGNIVFAVASTFALADIMISQGRLRDAVSTYQDTLKFASQQDEPVKQVIAHLYLGLTMLYHEMGDQEATAKYLQKSKDFGQQSALPDWPYRWCLAQAELEASNGNLESALELLENAKLLYIRNPLPDLRPIDALQARVYIRLGQLSQAQAWADVQNLSVDDELSYLREFEHLVLARVLIAEYACDPAKNSVLDAIGLLERLLNAAEDGKRLASKIEILILQALAFDLNKDKKSAMIALERALLQAKPEGFIRIFVDEGPPMARLLYEALSKDIAQDYVRKLLAAFPVTEPKKAALNQPTASDSDWIEPLSDRELEVLHLIAEGLSRPEIAAKLFLSKNTVKTHARNIYGKLGVNNQMQAVGKARGLGLLKKD